MDWSIVLCLIGTLFIPQILAGLSSLEVLHLNDNELQDLPRSLGNLVCLKELHLQYNKLTDLPAELGQLQCLEILNLEGNPLAGYNLPPSEAVARLIQLTSESVASPSGLNLVAFREQMLVLHEERNGTLIRHPHSSLWTEDRGGEQVTNLIDPLLLPGREQESSADLNTTVRVSKAGEGPDVLTLESYKEISENDTVCQVDNAVHYEGNCPGHCALLKGFIAALPARLKSCILMKIGLTHMLLYIHCSYIPGMGMMMKSS